MKAKKKARRKASGAARAAALHAEIDKLKKGGRRSGEEDKRAPPSPRDYIQGWMAEHDKKPKGK
jgi:hypothetical protein